MSVVVNGSVCAVAIALSLYCRWCCIRGGTTHSKLVQLVDESADRCRHSAVSSSAVPGNADDAPCVGRVPWHAVSAGRRPASVPRKPNSTAARRWSVVAVCTAVM